MTHLTHPTEGGEARHVSVPRSIDLNLSRGASQSLVLDATAGTKGPMTDRVSFSYAHVVDKPVPPLAHHRRDMGEPRVQLPDVVMLIVDDCTLHRENLAAMFTLGAHTVPAVAWDLPSLIASLGERTPEIVLLNMGTHGSVGLLGSIRQRYPDVKVIAVGISDDDESTIVACAEAGVAGYHLRTESLDDLIKLISKVIKGESACSPRVTTILLKRLSALAAQRQPVVKEPVLTSREIQILGMLELGLSNREIADHLCIALHTVKNHVHSVLTKLGASTRTEAVALSRTVHYS